MPRLLEKSDLVSVIIPIYNCEKYLRKTLESLIEQTHKNLEIILVNDGSKDKSGEICDEFQKKDSRINVIHKENGGVAKARNEALKKTKGTYIYFMDSDDYIESTMLEDLIDLFTKYNVDLVNSGFFSEVHMIGKDNKTIVSLDKISYDNHLYESSKEIRKDLVNLWDKHMLYNIWNKLYLAKVIKENNIYFPDYNWGEDIEFNRRYLLNINSMYNTEKCYYHYIRERQGALTTKFNPRLFEVRLKENKEFIDFFDKFGLEKNEYEEFIARRYLERTLGCIENLYKPSCSLAFIEKYREIKKIIKNDFTKESLRLAKPTSRKVKLMIIPYKLNLTLITMLMGKTLATIKYKFPDKFNRLKNKR